jgi:hypothetical protein
MNALQGAGLGGTAASTIAAGASGSLPFQITPQAQAFQDYLKQQQGVGAASLREQFGSRGLGYGSNYGVAAGTYQAQSQTDLANALAQYQLGQNQQQLSAAEFGLGAVAQPALQTYSGSTLVTGPSLLQNIIGAAGAAGSLFTGLFGGSGLFGGGGGGGGGGISATPVGTPSPLTPMTTTGPMPTTSYWDQQVGGGYPFMFAQHPGLAGSPDINMGIPNVTIGPGG